MIKVLLSVLVLLAISSIVNAQAAVGSESQPLSISSLNTPFAMQADFDGEYRLYPDRIELTFTKTDVHISEHCPYKGRRSLSALKIGLATETEKGWKISYGSEEVVVGQVMNPGDLHHLGELHFTIPIDPKIDLSKYWLVIQMEDNVLDVSMPPGAKGYAYAHTCREIFAR